MGPSRPNSFENLVRLTQQQFHRILYFGDDESETYPTQDRTHLSKDEGFDVQKWGPILSLTDEAVVKVALQYQRHLMTELTQADEGVSIASAELQARVVRHAVGFNNRVFIVEYSDGWSICVRVPACGWGDHWSELHIRNFTSQACTMRYIRENTNLPMPEMLQIDETFNNALGAPFMIMTAVKGREANAIWFDDAGLTPSQLEQKRQNILKTLATGMSELRNLEFDTMGTLHFSGGLPTSLGERISEPTVGPCYNWNFGWLPDKTNKHENDAITHPYPTSQSWLRDRLEKWWKEMHIKDSKKGGEQKSYLEHRGIYILYSMMLEYFPYSSKSAGMDPYPEKFVLAPPDFDWQNTLVAEDGAVQAYIDWDRAETLPRYLGWACVPNFLSADWRIMYEWPAKHAMPPSELARYREDYSRYMREACGDETDCYRYTPKSHYFSSIEFAIGDAKLMEEMVFKFLDLLVPRTRKDEHVIRLGDEGFREGEEEWLREQFKNLFAC
ncbi:hypothetical protein AOQ84DRAFT_373247 [Glonium stellatum]|uniref:Aminoglycoside phosphotransferase domain-containing protein n=1 Tax=Glonium stellatum TaxID=574774 RepID=A0A8E2F978_9PEZI|nr:hypothetical protein AOQ84DRAFT_373247 [Glonium stellatum]